MSHSHKHSRHKRRVHVQITGRTAHFIGKYPFKRLRKFWSFQIPNWNYIRDKYSYWDEDEGKYKYRWDGKIQLLKYDQLPAGLFWATYKEAEKEAHVRFKIHKHSSYVELSNPKHWILSGKDKDVNYGFQNQCMAAIQNREYAGGGLILAATGTGKTRMAAMLASRLKCELLFVVDELVLLEQARHDIAKHLGEYVGKVGESEFKPGRVTVATIQTLARHIRDRRFLEWFRKVEVQIIDEIHVQMNRSNFSVLERTKPKLVLGLTATLALSRKEIRMKAYSMCGPVLYEFPLQAGVKAGVLSKGIAVELQYDNSIHDVEAYTSKDLYDKKVMVNNERNHIIARIIKRAHKLGKYTIVLVDRLKHLEEISERLHGVPRKIVAGSYKGIGIHKLERMQSKLKFEQGEIRVIIASKVFKKGVSINRLDLIIDAAGRKSREDAIQKFGRGVRRHKHKKGLIYIDISDHDYKDKYRDKHDKKNPLAKAARRRMKALKSIGIKVYPYQWDDNSTATELLRKGEKWLKQELKK